MRMYTLFRKEQEAAMANRITVNICGEDYTLVAEENTAYMEQVASLVDKK